MDSGIAWLIGQKKTRDGFIHSAYEKYWKELEEGQKKEMERQLTRKRQQQKRLNSRKRME